jgi:hypothetical protein
MYLLAGIEKGHRRGVDGPDFEMAYCCLEGAAAANFAGGIDEPTCNHQANPETGLCEAVGQVRQDFSDRDCGELVAAAINKAAHTGHRFANQAASWFPQGV